jgi:hypothetical protein
MCEENAVGLHNIMVMVRMHALTAHIADDMFASAAIRMPTKYVSARSWMLMLASNPIRPCGAPSHQLDSTPYAVQCLRRETDAGTAKKTDNQTEHSTCSDRDCD